MKPRPCPRAPLPPEAIITNTAAPQPPAHDSLNPGPAREGPLQNLLKMSDDKRGSRLSIPQTSISVRLNFGPPPPPARHSPATPSPTRYPSPRAIPPRNAPPPQFREPHTPEQRGQHRTKAPSTSPRTCQPPSRVEDDPAPHMLLGHRFVVPRQPSDQHRLVHQKTHPVAPALLGH